jgi:hypothetical protein
MQFEKARLFFQKYERWVSPVTLVCGFILDNIMLRRIDALFSNAILLSYLMLSALGIAALNIHEHKRGERERSKTLHFVVVFILQFCLGGIFSGAFIFYSKSGSLLASWPFLLLLVAYIIGNEILRRNYVRLGFQVAVFFTALFSFLIFFLPVILGVMGDAIFLLSGITSLIITGVFIYVLSWFAPARTKASAPIIALSVLALFAFINGLYFTNLIPPIPLSLRLIGVYDYVAKTPDGEYETLGEKQSRFRFLPYHPTVHLTDSGKLYVLSAIFAPTGLRTDVVHVWEHFDEGSGTWMEASRVTLPISGGRADGFRTFSSRAVVPGEWRVDVRTPRGALVGRLSFTVAPGKPESPLVTEIR